MKKLIPADTKICQAEIPNGNSFMTMGGVSGRVRCKNKAFIIAKEIEPQKDGLIGEMSMCENCFERFKKVMPEKKVKIKKIKLL